MKKYYIAYGSNLNIPQMRRRCRDAKIVGTAIIKDYRLMFKGSQSGSYLTIEKAEGYVVPVGVWSVSEDDEKCLDRYEGYPDFYYKAEMDLDIKGYRTGRIYHRKCFIYIMHEDRLLGVPSEHYCLVCKDGYVSFGFDLDYLLEAYEYSWEGRGCKKVVE